MGCLKLTYDYQEQGEKNYSLDWQVWVNPERDFLGVGNQQTQGGITYAWWEDALYEANKFNPLAVIINNVNALITGVDFERGNPVSLGDASANLISIIPLAKIGQLGKLTYTLGVHALEQMAERGVSEKMIQLALEKGSRYYDPKNGTINYILQGGFASGKDLLVGQNPLTGKIATVIRGDDLVSKRFIKIN